MMGPPLLMGIVLPPLGVPMSSLIKLAGATVWKTVVLPGKSDIFRTGEKKTKMGAMAISWGRNVLIEWTNHKGRLGYKWSTI